MSRVDEQPDPTSRVSGSLIGCLSAAICAAVLGASGARAADPVEESANVASAAVATADADGDGDGYVDGDAADFSDEELETFAAIYVSLRDIAEKYERRIAAVESEQEAQEVQAEMQQESLETLERHGWTEQKFSQFARTLNQRPDLVEKTIRLIEERT